MLEHVESPHRFLRKVHQLLEPSGLLVLFVPAISSVGGLALHRLPWIGRYFVGYLASDDINAFTPSTVAFTCERAGFETIETVEVTPSFPGPSSLFNRVPPLASLVDGSTYISRTIPNWEYHPKATRQASSQVSN